MTREQHSHLRHVVKGLSESPAAFEPVSLGVPAIDAALGGGLARGRLHEIYAAATADIGAATGFAVGVASRAATKKPILWVRQDFLDTETGRLNASGLAELGLDPACLILVRARDGEGVLRAGEQGARCPALGAVVIEPWGSPRILDLTASRRLSLAACKSGVPVVMLRVAAAPSQSAATTRWSVAALASRPLAANAPGFPAFELSLLRHRGGGDAGRAWRVEWNRDRKCFQDQKHSSGRPDCVAPLPGSVVSVSDHRPAEAAAVAHKFRRTG